MCEAIRHVGPSNKIEITKFYEWEQGRRPLFMVLLIFKPWQSFVIGTILLAHASRLINAEEFVLLYDLHKP